ncbi:MAG: DUF5752 family protein [Thermoproteota archaeon]
MSGMKEKRKLRRKSCPAFYFFTDIGCYTGKLAINLVDFCSKIENVTINSIQFHCRRGDFQKWIRECIGDSELADRISEIPKSLKGEKLREKVHQLVNKRIEELKESAFEIVN